MILLARSITPVLLCISQVAGVGLLMMVTGQFCFSLVHIICNRLHDLLSRLVSFAITPAMINIKIMNKFTERGY